MTETVNLVFRQSEYFHKVAADTYKTKPRGHVSYENKPELLSCCDDPWNHCFTHLGASKQDRYPAFLLFGCIHFLCWFTAFHCWPQHSYFTKLTEEKKFSSQFSLLPKPIFHLSGQPLQYDQLPSNNSTAIHTQHNASFKQLKVEIKQLLHCYISWQYSCFALCYKSSAPLFVPSPYPDSPQQVYFNLSQDESQERKT